MKQLFALIVFGTLSTTAFAHPGGHKLVCQSAKNSGSKDKVAISLYRSNGKGFFAPIIKVSINQKEILLHTPDDLDNYGTSFYNSPLGSITVSAEVPFEEKTNNGHFKIVAIPKTVKAFDPEGKPVKWSFKAQKEDCYDTNGSATFKAIIDGYIYFEGTDGKQIETQILDCELTYNSGMTC